jgi:hypothetical protein
LTNRKEVTVYGVYKDETCYTTGFRHDENLMLLLTPNDDETLWLMQFRLLLAKEATIMSAPFRISWSPFIPLSTKIKAHE